MSNSADRRPGREAAALLAFYAEAGIDVLVGEAPRNRFAETEQEAAAQTRAKNRAETAAPQQREAASARASSGDEATRAAPQPSAPQAFATVRVAVPDDVAIADARERARSAASLEELEASLASFEGCNLKATARSLVFGNGAADADLMFIGEAPGREEDAAGAPFVGRSGKLLDRMLSAIGVERQAVRVTNTVPWRPPGNRPPTPAETEICRPFIIRQIELVRPRIIVCLGSPAVKAVLRTDEGIMRLRGRWLSFTYGVEQEEIVPAMPMLHPAYLLRQPAQKRLAWRDLLALKERLDGDGKGSQPS
ncbi:uracil-DNA glycosylase family protein [Consotaella salsifontis]|uniref:Type-4 uracil-DNA glycosylase n=1 Tax=Consotaella salsifontis TaxID=1365950 RepID=A0A1T4SW45_9HYPH|nr:uracil-DNA glycosylase family protein [Consotaella salsifontis]SKA32490.1 DNA polymerase [Consotaella salsifontis]